MSRYRLICAILPHPPDAAAARRNQDKQLAMVERAEEILAVLRREGFKPIDAPSLVSMLSLGGRPDDLDAIEKLLETVEREMGLVPRESNPRSIRFDPGKGICSR